MAKNNRFSSSSTGTTTGRDFDNADTGQSGAREKVSNLGSTANQRIDSSPLIALGAGAALGAVLGAVLPRTDKERELLAPVGLKLADASTSAIDRARETGKQKFDEMAGDSVRQFFGAGTTGDSADKDSGGGAAA